MRGPSPEALSLRDTTHVTIFLQRLALTIPMLQSLPQKKSKPLCTGLLLSISMDTTKLVEPVVYYGIRQLFIFLWICFSTTF